MTGLAPIDGGAALALLAKAVGYGAFLLAMGGVLFAAAFRHHADPRVLRVARHIAVAAAVLGLAVLALRFGIRAARISGMGLEGATDPVMLGFVWQSPLGTAAIWRGLGALVVIGSLMPAVLRSVGPRIATGGGIAGAIAIALSYTQVGHTLGAPRVALAGLLGLHVLAAAFWVGALLPLHRATHSPTGANLLHRFGRVASYGVGALVLAGGLLAWLLSGSWAALFGTAYGLGLMLKVVCVGGLLGIAAVNKLRLVPALRTGQTGAATALRRAIVIEMLAVGAILLATAALTTVTTPPVNL